ncbi:MAG TPA: DUF309 domain-containing protein [Nocardioidaceae bacterium]|nr:DUF309 domain-containing protein [Nocardioidaceae bacterium]
MASAAGDRDRDPEGRARQARPRDELGRPLPYGSKGVEPVSEDPLPPDETLRYARELVDEGRPFSAHEVLEARWKAGPDEQGDLWQGLAQICVGLTHALRGNRVGAGRLVDRGCARLDAYAATGGPTYGLDLAAVAECARGRLDADPSGSGHAGGDPAP